MKPAEQNIAIIALQDDAQDELIAHLQRHFAESGEHGFHFIPFDPKDDASPAGFSMEHTRIAVGEGPWQRWFVAQETATGAIIGHVNLKAYALKTSAHRCLLGIGLERNARARGLGRKLMQTAIAFAQAQDGLSWLDLMVFGHNTPARTLYESLGFVQTGIKTDCFRIGDTSIDDVYMSLPLRSGLPS